MAQHSQLCNLRSTLWVSLLGQQTTLVLQGKYHSRLLSKKWDRITAWNVMLAPQKLVFVHPLGLIAGLGPAFFIAGLCPAESAVHYQKLPQSPQAPIHWIGGCGKKILPQPPIQWIGAPNHKVHRLQFIGLEVVGKNLLATTSNPMNWSLSNHRQASPYRGLCQIEDIPKAPGNILNLIQRPKMRLTKKHSCAALPRTAICTSRCCRRKMAINQKMQAPARLW